VEGVRAFQATHAKYIKMPFTVLLEAPPCFHPIGMACVSGDGSVCH